MAEAHPADVLNRVAFLLEASNEPGYRVRAFRRAARAASRFSVDELRALAARGSLRSLPDIGEVTERIIIEVLAGEPTPDYLKKLEEKGVPEQAPLAPAVAELRAALRGDCHTHSDWSDGGNTIREMAETAIALGQEYMALTDHSPRLTVARGLTAGRLREQLAVVAELNAELAPFRILTGIECDILEDGSLDQEPDLLAQLDVVVGSVHSKLRQDAEGMTKRMLAAVANPNLDILGHCTGRLITGRGRPESQFDAETVFSACLRYDKAVEINSRPERLDPPPRLLQLAAGMGCRFAIDTDAHAPGQLFWLSNGCEMALAAGIGRERIVNAQGMDELLEWTASHH